MQQIQKVSWSKIAIQSLNSTNTFILSLWNTTVSSQFLNEIDESISYIKKYPNIGKRIIRTDIRQLNINKQVNLFYKIEGDTLKILLIWNNKQNPKDLIRKISIIK